MKKRALDSSLRVNNLYLSTYPFATSIFLDKVKWKGSLPLTRAEFYSAFKIFRNFFTHFPNFFIF